MEIGKRIAGCTENGRDIAVYTLKNRKGMQVSVSELGAAIISVLVPDREGRMADVVLGYDDAESYFDNQEFFGVTVGRNANRTAGASFELDGHICRLEANEGPNNLHSSLNAGFHRKLWTAAPDEGRNSVSMGYLSPDGENGFPGTLDMKVTFSLWEDCTLSIRYEGISDRKTVINCTNHSYFNLGGHDSGKILDHRIRIAASRYTPLGKGSIPTGEMAPVEGTALDFRSSRRMGDGIDGPDPQVEAAGGYDHNFVLKCLPGEPAAVAEDPVSGRKLEVYTDLPGLQFYTGNYIREGLRGKGGAVYGKRSGFCLETQYFPNSVNQKGFQRPVFNAGQKYDTTTSYRFLAE